VDLRVIMINATTYDCNYPYLHCVCEFDGGSEGYYESMINATTYDCNYPYLHY
jgi:hypothetical protein